MTSSPVKPPRAGDVAPDFNIPSTSGVNVMLSSFRDQKHVLLAFFPAAFTRVCTVELCAFGTDFDAFTNANVQVFPISVDAIPSLKEYRNKFDMKVDLLSDFRREVSRAYGVLREDTFASERAYFLIDTSGIIKWAHVEDATVNRRENDEILSIIKAEVG